MLILLLFVVLAPAFIQSFAIADDAPLQHYKEIWDAQRPKLNSGIIRYKQFSASDFKIPAHDKVRSLFQELSKDREDYPAILRDFASKLSNVDGRHVAPEYPDLMLYCDGRRMRYERYGGIDLFNGDTLIEARHVKVNDPSMQITVQKGVQFGTEGVLEFYDLPSAEVVDKLIVTSSQPDIVRLESSPGKPVIDGFTMIVSTNGDVLETQIGDPAKPSHEHIYSAFKSFDGVRLPQLSFYGTYNNGKLASVSVAAILDAKFNLNIDGNMFVQEVKAGDVIVNIRDGTVSRAERDADNVLNSKAWSNSK